MDNYIKNQNIIIKIVCERKIISKLKAEIGDYYEFVIGNYQQNFTIYIFIDNGKYKKILNNVNNMKYKMKLFKDRDGQVILDKDKNELIAFYTELNDNVIQFIEEIIISIFGIFLTKQKYFFLHAACVEKNRNAVAIIGDRASGKTTLLNVLMQNDFNFVCNSHLGIKDVNRKIEVIGAPSRVGMRVETLEKCMNANIRKKIFLNTEFRKRFGKNAENNLKSYRVKKFNIKVNELKKIYNIQIVSTSTLKLIIVPLYIEQLNHIKIIKVEENNKSEIFMKNKRDGVYDTTKYMNYLDTSEKNTLPKNLSKIKMYKVYQNEKCIEELLKFIQLEIGE